MFLESFLFAKFGFYYVLVTIFFASIALLYLFGFCKNMPLFVNSKKTTATNTEFILMVVHKLRTSLSGIKWSLKMFLDGDFGQINKEQEDIVKKVYQKTNVTISSVDDLLDLYSIADGVHVYNMNLSDVEGIIQAVVDDYKEAIKNKNIKFSFEKIGESNDSQVIKNSTIAMLDKDAMGVVMQNLLDNAIKYTPAGNDIKVSLRIVDKTIEIQVKDSGIGIPKQKQGQIFNKFFRAENAIKIERSGMGLGLFVAKNVIEDHKGKIWFESQENKGTTFFVSLPIAFAKKV